MGNCREEGIKNIGSQGVALVSGINSMSADLDDSHSRSPHVSLAATFIYRYALSPGMDISRLEAELAHLETATDTAVQLTELEWKASGLSDEGLAVQYQDMFRRLQELSERSLQEDLRHTDPKALFDMVRYAKHLGMWRGYADNQRRLKYVTEQPASDQDDQET